MTLYGGYEFGECMDNLLSFIFGQNTLNHLLKKEINIGLNRHEEE